MTSKTAGKLLFFSLVWKAILAVSFATFLASAAIVMFGEITLEKNYEQERVRVRNSYRQIFSGIIERVQNERVDIGWLIPAMTDETTSRKNALDVIKNQLDRNWFKIEVESDIESAFLFNRQGNMIGSWGNTLYEGQFSEWLEYVISKEEPFDNILFQQTCIHFHAAPFLFRGEFIGIFIFGIDLSDIVLQMKNITGSSVGIVNLPDISQNNATSDLALWNANIVALTDANKNKRLLSELSKEHSLAQTKQSVFFGFENRQYEILGLPLNGHNKTLLILIEDITQGLADIKKATDLYAISGLLSFVLSGSVLLFLLLSPTRRLKSLITALPLISQKNYSDAKKFLPCKRRKLFFKDEIDDLEDTAHEFISTLKYLDEQVNQRTQKLSLQTLELQAEKNFIDTILNTAQVMIITIDSKGLISSANKFTETLTSYSEQELLGKQFINLMIDQRARLLVRTSIDLLLKTHKGTQHRESAILSMGGNELYISWYFSPLLLDEGKTDESNKILVVGLDLTERRKYENQLTWLAEHDPLTGLYNRRKFETELVHALAMAVRYDHNSALIFFDIDQFKYVNDSSGHHIGDELLIKVAEKLRATTRKTDVVARFGGDEFIILLPEVTQKEAEEFVQKLCNDLKTVHISVGEELHTVSVSAGLIVFPEQSCTSQDLLATADLAMYRAKQGGRGGWRLASQEDINRLEIKTRVNWKTKIDKGLAENRFVLYFQPIMKISDRSVSHYECLLRMKDDDGSIIPPAMFVPVAEQMGLILQLDQRVLELAFKEQASLLKAGKKIKLAINLSGEMLSAPNAFELISHLLREFDLDASHFIFEVTETQAVTNLQAAHDFITQINRIGGSFALDDFGSGFSSMNYLKQLPVSYLKIDGAFVKNILDNQVDQLFVKAINSIGHGMGIKTIAEFVENDSIFEKLYELQIDYAQGYGIAKPLPSPDYDFYQSQTH
ncbi:MAG: EAL domain-containing protein [Methylicorpusculum sp.]|nr:EAL domain-containing protein [Methylicorpusculum sp.]